ncbi:MAG TPA: hypothetical protein VI260_00790, partial [Blastocatellia bacterium]
RDSYDSLQTGHQLSTIQIATTKRKLASAQSIKAVFIRKMDFLLWTRPRPHVVIVDVIGFDDGNRGRPPPIQAITGREIANGAQISLPKL